MIDRWTPREGLTHRRRGARRLTRSCATYSWSPRVSAASGAALLRDTKLSAGFGIFYDALSLGTLTRHQDQVSYSTFFDPAGVPVRGPVETAFLLNEHGLRVPRYRTMSAAVERKLPFDFYGKAAWTRRLGSHGVTFVNELDADLAGGLYLLRNWRHDTYQSVELRLRRTFGRFEWALGYTRSSARTDAVVDYSLENPIFGRQGPGPFPWDAPNRVLMWGWAPVPTRHFPGWLRTIVGADGRRLPGGISHRVPLQRDQRRGRHGGAAQRPALPGLLQHQLTLRT